MNGKQQAFFGATDLQAMAALARAFPADNLHVIDLPYRFSSWALDDPQNTQLWLDDAGNLVGWAVMQTPFWAIDYACHPAASDELHPQILAWAEQIFVETDNYRDAAFALYESVGFRVAKGVLVFRKDYESA